MAHDTKNFKVSEFACKCCGKNEIQQVLIDLVQKIRDKLGAPIHINSGYRCPKHNAEVGGVKNSTHVRGLAADLRGELGAKATLKVIQDLDKEGKIPEMSFCKEYKTFIHVDCGQKRKNRYDLLR